MPAFYTSKNDLIKSIQQSTIHSKRGKLKLVACVIQGSQRNHLWSVWKTRGLSGDVEFYIRIDVIFERENMWASQSLWEEENPLYIDCPTVFLSMAPTVQSSVWRRRVEEYALRAHRKIDLGGWYLLDNQHIPFIEVIAVEPEIIGQYRGVQYKVSKNLILSEIEGKPMAQQA